MSALILKESKNTPEVILDSAAAKYSIKGKCFPENSKKYFTPIYDWFTSAKIAGECKLEVFLDYLSSSSVISILELFRHIEKCATENGYKVKVVWTYEDGDDDMVNVVNNYKKLCSLPIEMEVEE